MNRVDGGRGDGSGAFASRRVRPLTLLVGLTVCAALVLGGCARGQGAIRIVSEPPNLPAYVVPESEWGDLSPEDFVNDPRALRKYRVGDTTAIEEEQPGRYYVVVVRGDSATSAFVEVREAKTRRVELAP